MTCKCGKTAQRKHVATKTTEIGGHTVIDQQREALVCAQCGVIAWDPPQVSPPRQTVYPNQTSPFVIPARPYPYPSPNTAPPWQQRLTWANVC
jgi:hypothetical protein